MSPRAPPKDPRKGKGGVLPSEGTIIRLLSGVQYTSGLVFSAFVGAHLLAPIAAAIGGGAASDKTMLLTREYYHAFENFAVWVPLGLHLSAALTKRALLFAKTRRMPQLNTLILSGWTLAVIVPIHFTIQRLIPALPDPPISSLSPSEMGFDFVAFAARHRPVTSFLAYLSLAAVIVPHAWIGLNRAIPWALRKLGLRRSSEVSATKGREDPPFALTLGVIGVVVVMFARMFVEGGNVSPVMMKRYEAVHGMMPWEKIGIRL